MKYTRQKLIQLIHIGKNHLRMDEDTYRIFIKRITNKNSCSDMNNKELLLVFNSMQNQGFLIKRKPIGHSQQYTLSNITKKIRAKWLEMYDQGIVQDSSENALNNYVKKIAKNRDGEPIPFVNWLSNQEATKVLETLKKWQQRYGRHYGK